MVTSLQFRFSKSKFFYLEVLLILSFVIGNISVQAQADECASAFSSISVGSDCISSTISGNTAGLTDSSYDSSCGPFSEDHDGWYWISSAGLSIGDMVTIEVVSASGDMVLSAVSTDVSCSSYTNLDCSDATAIGLETVTFTYNDATAYYMIHILEYSGASTSFDLCVYTSGGGGGSGPANDDCIGAVPLTQGLACIAVPSDLADATDSGTGSCSGTADDDVWFSFVATTTNPTIEVNSGFGFDEVIELYSGNCASPTYIGCGDFDTFGEVVATTGLTIGETYYIKVYSYGSSAPLFSSFDICVYGIPVGTGSPESDCSGSTILCSNGSVAYNPVGPGNDDFSNPNNSSGCLSSEHLSAWYYFEINENAAPGSTLSFDIIPSGGASEDYDFAIFGPNVDCDALGAPIRCSFAAVGSNFPSPGSTGIGNGASDLSEDAFGDSYVAELVVNPGEGYFLLVDNYDSSNNPFTLNFGGTASLECNTSPPCGITTNAGTDDFGCSGGSSITLTGSAIGVTGGETYNWTATPAIANSWITNSSSSTTTINIPPGTTIGDYTFSLGVTEATCTDNDNVVITVEDCCSAEAGTVTGSTQNICPNNTVTAGVTGNQTNADYTQNYLLVDASGNVIDLNTTGTFTLTNCNDTYTIYSYNYLTTGTAPTNPATISSIDCSTNCCDLEAGTFTVSAQDNDLPIFTSPPANITVDCSAIPQMNDLAWTDNCSGTGTVTGSEVGTADPCGYTLARTWTYTDDCNNTATHTQEITVNPVPQASFISPPANTTVNCDAVPTAAPSLSYDNGETGSCAISGTVTASETGSYDACGGMITYTWTFTDACNRTITTSQEITINPAPEANFISPPANMTVDCANIPPLQDLTYSNGESGTCEIAGTITATEVSDGNTCPETITRTWTFTDACNRTTTTSQIIQVTDTELPIFETPPSALIVPCGGSAPTMTMLMWTDNCDGSGSVLGTDSSNGGTPEIITRTWTYTDNCNNTATETQIITINTFSIDQSLIGICNDNGTLSDPSDDFFDVTIDASIGASGVSNSFIVNDGSLSYGPFTYGSGGGIIPNLPADGSTITLTFTDSDDPACTETVSVNQNSCSTSCALTIDDATASACNDNGTPSDNSDDTFTVNVNASAVNGGTSFTVTDGITIWGPFPYGTGGTITGLAADGASIALTYIDNTDTGCTAQTTVSQTSCSNLCALTIEQSLAGLCDDNGTPTDPSDDTFDVTINASALNGGGTYSVSDGTSIYGPFTYGAVSTVMNLPADGSTITLIYTDSVDPACTATTSISQSSCSSTCALTIDDATASTCNDNGTPSDNSDDTFTVNVNASAVNGGTSFTVTDGITIWGPFPYGTGGTITGLAADGASITLTYIDNTDAGCAAQTTVSQTSCSNLCALTITQTAIGLCNDNGTPSDATDDFFDVSISATALNGSGTGYSVSDGISTFGPFSYGISETISSLSANGTNITLTFIDDDDSSCSQTAIVTQSSCSNQCEITITQDLVGSCNDNGTPSDPSDDTFDVTVNATAVNGSASFSVTDGSIIYGPFAYGTGGLVTGLSATGSNISLTFFDNNDNTCNAVSVVSQISCSNQCELTIENTTVGLCNNNGTLSDPSDDTYSVTISATALNGNGSYQVTNGIDIWGPFLYGVNEQITNLPADGSNITLTFTDIGDASCSASVTISQVSCSTDCVLTIEDATAGICQANGTPSDASDDTFQVSVDASILNGGAQFNVTAMGLSFGPFTYGTGGIIQNLPANGTDITLTFTDIDNPGCSNQIIVNQASCSDVCDLSIQQVTAGICNNSGTPTNPNDDIFDVIINASALNGNNTYTVTIGGSVFGPFTYNTNEIISGLPADGSNITLTFTDSNDATCTGTANVSQASCSSNCELSIIEETIITCNDNGTPTDPSDDTFEMNITATSLNGGSSYFVNSATNSWGPFLYGISQNITDLPAGGIGVILTFTDIDDSNCAAQTTAFSPTCSDECAIIVDQIVTGLCDDANTPSDPIDDTFDVSIQVSSLNGGASFIVSEGTSTYGPFTYTNGGTITDLPADGSVITLVISDVDDPNCSTTTVVSQGSCSDMCLLEVNNFIIGSCNDNGTPSDASDDFFDTSIEVTLTNGSNNFMVTDGVSNWGPFAVINGTGTGTVTNLPTTGTDITLFVFDMANNSCATQIEVSQASCSNDCALSINQALIGLCNSNGTLSDTSDDTYNVTVNASALNGASNFTVSDGINTYGPFFYSTGGVIPDLPADGSIITLLFTDTGDTNCTATTTVSQVSCSTNCELSIDQLITDICDNNGTPSDATDDTYNVTVNASSVNGGTDFTVTDGTTIWGPFPYTTGGVVSNLPANGIDITLTFTDTSDNGCANQSIVNQASCSDLCAINIESAVAGLCNNNGTLSDPSDDTYSVTVDASSLNGSTNFNVFDGTTTYGPFAYVSGGVIPNLPANGNTITLTFTDENDTDCTATTSVSQQSCSTNCLLSIESLTTGPCNDNGTPSDPSDDIFEVTVNASSVNGGSTFTVTDGANVWGPFDYNIGGTIPDCPANGGDIILIFIDSDNSNCTNQGIVNQTSCSDLCALSIDQAAIGLCDNNGTLSDAADDTYSVTVNASSINGGINFTVFDGTLTYGPFAYGVGGIITDLPADESTINLIFIDENDTNCTASTTVSQVSCSTNCLLSIDEVITQVCNDNNTPSDPVDDTFDVLINTSAINGNGQYIVTDGINTWGPFDYNTQGLVTGLLATGSDIILTVTDAIDSGCAAQTTVSQSSCSDLCVLNILMANETICNDNGTNTDTSDDTYSVDVNAESLNGGAEFFVSDGTNVWGPFSYGNGGQVNDLPADGSIINLTFYDSNDNNCLAQTTVTQGSCSSTCTLSINSSIIGNCNDNNTGADSTDDTYSVTLNVSSVNGNTTYSVLAGGNTYGPFNYDQDEIVAGLPANSMNITLLLVDDNDANCNLQIDVSQDSCSDCNLTAEAGNSQTISCSTPEVTLTGSSNEANVTYQWTGPTGFSLQTTASVTTNIPGMYFLEITNPTTGCIETDEVQVNENLDLPTVTTSVNGEITCDENSTAILTANTTVSNPQFLWTGPDGMTYDTQTIEISLAGEYSVIVTDLDVNCDSSPAIANVTENTIPPIAIIQDVMDELNCATIAGGITLNSEGSSIGNNIAYQWSLEDEIIGTNATQTIFQGGEYILIVTNILTNCTNAATVNVEENVQFPIAAAGMNSEINCYTNEVTLDGSNSTNLPSITYEWNGPTGGVISGQMNSVAVASIPGMYILTVTETETFCTSLDTVFVTQNTQDPDANISGNFDLDCNTESGVLSNDGSSTGNNINYQWSDTFGEINGATGSELNVDSPGTYSLLVFDVDNGCSSIATTLIEELEVDIQLTASSENPDCFGEENGIITIDTITGSNAPFLVSIDEGDLTTTSSFSGLAGGSTYLITVEDALGCTVSEEFTLEEPDELFLDLGENQIINLGEIIEIPVVTNITTNQIDVLLLNTDTLYNCDICSTEVQPIGNTDYTGTLIDENGCITTDIVSVVVRKETQIFVPNSFSPDDDGVNDIVFPYASPGVEFIKQFYIYDRWGEVVHSYFNFPANQQEYGWDGNFNGQKMNPGVFVWYLEAEMLDGRTVVVKGDITLFR